MIALLVAAFMQAASATSQPMRTIDAGAHSTQDEPRLVVVRTPDAWAALWRRHSPARPLPQVDFSKEMVVGVFLGTRPTPGYGVIIDSVSDENGTLLVRYREKRPPRDAILAQVLTSPFALVAVPARAGDVRFEKSQD